MMRGLLTLLTLAAIGLASIGSTGAFFSSTQNNGANRYDAKSDWVAPTVSMTDPGTNLRGTVTLNATAADTPGSGVQSVVIERSPAGAGAWTTVCTDTSSPYSCSLDTTTGATPDGLYDFRARATDNSSNSATSTTVTNRRIDNTAPTSVSVTDSGANIGGTVSLGGAASDSGSGVATLTVQWKPSAGSTWTDACTATTSPYSCSFNTATGATPDGLYDFRAVATDVAGNSTTSSSVTNRRIDNTAPTGVTMTDPAPSGFISGTKALSGAASDTGGSGIASVRFQYRPSSGGLWLDACTDTTSPYGCSVDTTLITDGLYDWQALATDNAGNTTVSTAWTSRRIDNTAPTVTMDDPGAYIRGTVALTSSAADGGGIASVVIQYRTTPSGAWTTVCTDTTSPYSCSLNTTTLTTGTNYDFQAIATDNANRQTTSTVVSSRMVDNVAPSSATFTSPGTPLSGTVTLSGGGADANSGVGSVTMQYSPTGAGTWSSACVDTTSPYSCSFDTSTIADGVYDFRSLVTDRAGNTLGSTAVTGIRVDNFAPTVTLNDPGAAIRGTVTLGGSASDGGGIASVKIERSPAGSNTWTLICTDTVSPYSCSLNTTTLTDGLYDFRATATDNAGRTASSTVSSRRVDNTVPTGVTFTDPGSPLTGNVSFSGTALDTGGSGIASVKFQYLYLGFFWTTMCTATTSPYTCTADTSTIGDGSYSMRAVATDNAGNTTNSATIASRRIDNNPPTVTMGDPGGLNGTETLTATASDGSGSGVTSVTIQYSPTGASTWTDVCADTTSPYSCTLDTAPLPEGAQYDFRAVATDGVGFVGTSAVVGPRTVDRTPPTVTMTDPGTLSGTEVLASTANDSGSGLASVVYQYTAAGGSTWTTACTASASPWTCNWVVTGLAEGSLYDVRAVATDAAGNATTSATIANRVVDNDTTPAAANIQTANGGATAGVAQVNDSITFTFSEPIAPGSILSGWSGSSTSVVVRIDDFTTTPFDRLTVYDSTDGTLTALTAAGGVRLGGNYVPTSGVKFNANMVMSGNAVTVTFTSVRSGGVNGTAASSGTMQWSPSASALDLAGHPVGTATFNETGVADAEF